MARLFRFGTALLAVALLAPPALADCVPSQQRVPMASDATPAAATFRAHMARLDAPVGPPAAQAKRAKARAKARQQRAHVRRTRDGRKAAHAPARRRARPAHATQALESAPLVPGGMTPYRGAVPTPTPPDALASVMLLTRTICETGPSLASPVGPAPVVDLPGGYFPGDEVVDDETILVTPPPPFEEEPPFLVTPGGPPPGPPLGPPSETGLVPEPATWTMMILGFGAVGGMLRRRPAPKSVSRR